MGRDKRGQNGSIAAVQVKVWEWGEIGNEVLDWSSRLRKWCGGRIVIQDKF